MVRLHSSFFRAENAQIIILFEIPGKGVAGRKGGQVYGRSDGYAESCTAAFAEFLQSGRKRCEGETRTAGGREK